MELLSPAGNYKAFIGAINAGCDAVYLAGTKYGARAYADNFTDEEIIKAIRVAHLCGVKVYLTTNTLIKEREFKDVCNYIRIFYEHGLDGCIVQDIGLISVFNDLFPGLECHISTQGFATSVESVKLYKSVGAKRVVLARELSLEEIKTIKKKVDIEIETFVHGAMCYCYSGECLFSSALGGRSGNRGRCAGPCRLPYVYEGKEKYYLSMKDQCTINILPDLIDAGIDSLKIEGRMKKPEYAAFVTSVYRKYIDLYNNNPDTYFIENKDFEDLRHMYMRSEIGEGYYFRKNGKDMLSIDSPAYAGNDTVLMQDVSERLLSPVKRIGVDAFVSVFKDQRISLTLIDNNENVVTKEGAVALPANNKPLLASDIEKQISKTGDSVFYLNSCDVATDELSFLQIKELNELRRSAFLELEDSILSKRERVNSEYKIKISRKKRVFSKNPIISVKTSKQLDAIDDLKEVFIAVDYELFIKYKDRELDFLVELPDIVRNKDINNIVNIFKEISHSACGVIVRNYEELNLVLSNKYDGIVIAGFELYAFNKASLAFLKNVCDSVILPLELSKHELDDLDDNGQDYLLLYGKIPLMKTANCIVNTTSDCMKNKGDALTYVCDRMGANLPVFRNCKYCYNVIYNSVPTFLLDEKNAHKYNKYISFIDESYDEIKDIIEGLMNRNVLSPKKYTKSYWNRGIE